MKDKAKRTKKSAKKTKVVKKVVAKKPAKPVTKPKAAKVAKERPAKAVRPARAADWTPDSTTAWAQKRNLKQIVIWGPEAVRDKIRAASKRDGVPMSTWILDAIDARLHGGKSSSAAPKAASKAKPVTKAKTTTKRKPHPISEEERAAVSDDVTRSDEADEAAEDAA